jgi:hypothetical protein
LALKRYVNHFAPEKFKRCAAGARLLSTPRRTSEEKLDKFFKKLFRLPNGADDSELYSRVKDINLLEDELEFDQTLEKTHEPTEDARQIESLILDPCERWLDGKFAKRFQPGIFANALGLVSETSARSKKLIEYDHICWYVKQWKDSNRLFENIKRQLKRARQRKSFFNRICSRVNCAGN